MNTSRHLRLLIAAALAWVLASCARESSPADPSGAGAPLTAGQSAVADHESQKDIVKVAVGSAEHSTLVAAVKAAELVDVLANAGPFTVFAPTNAAFDKLPAGTVSDLLKPANREKLRDVLQYHVAVAVYRPEMLKDGMVLNMANSDNVRLSVRGGRILLNDSASVVASVPASNGIVHVVDAVLLPPAR